nr:uncharacterized protein LOC121117545 [Lepeophtheirus salmonis]
MAQNLDRPKSTKQFKKKKNGPDMEDDLENDEDDESEDLSQELDLMAYGVNKKVAEASIDDEDLWNGKVPCYTFVERGKITKEQYKETMGQDSINEKSVHDLFGEFLFTDTVHESTSIIKIEEPGDFQDSRNSSLTEHSDNLSRYGHSSLKYTPIKQSNPFRANNIKQVSPLVETSPALSSSYPELRKASGLRVLKEIRERRSNIEKFRSREDKDSRSHSSSIGRSVCSRSSSMDTISKEFSINKKPPRRPPAKLKPLLLSEDEIIDA